MLLGMRYGVLFDNGKRASKAVCNCHNVQNATHEFSAVTIARDAICEYIRVNVDPVQECDCGDLKSKKNKSVRGSTMYNNERRRNSRDATCAARHSRVRRCVRSGRMNTTASSSRSRNSSRKGFAATNFLTSGQSGIISD